MYDTNISNSLTSISSVKEIRNQPRYYTYVRASLSMSQQLMAEMKQDLKVAEVGEEGWSKCGMETKD